MQIEKIIGKLSVDDIKLPVGQAKVRHTFIFIIHAMHDGIVQRKAKPQTTMVSWKGYHKYCELTWFMNMKMDQLQNTDRTPSRFICVS
jgi:hypothetical protein